MNCQFINEHLIEYLEKELDETAHKEFSDHLSTCSACRELVTQVELTYKMAETPRELVISPNFVDTTVQKLTKKEARVIPMFYKALKPIAVAASIALGIIIGNGELSILDTNSQSVEDQDYTLSAATPSDYSVWLSYEEDYGNED